MRFNDFRDKIKNREILNTREVKYNFFFPIVKSKALNLKKTYETTYTLSKGLTKLILLETEDRIQTSISNIK